MRKLAYMTCSNDITIDKDIDLYCMTLNVLCQIKNLAQTFIVTKNESNFSKGDLSHERDTFR